MLCKSAAKIGKALRKRCHAQACKHGRRQTLHIRNAVACQRFFPYFHPVYGDIARNVLSTRKRLAQCRGTRIVGGDFRVVVPVAQSADGIHLYIGELRLNGTCIFNGQNVVGRGHCIHCVKMRGGNSPAISLSCGGRTDVLFLLCHFTQLFLRQLLAAKRKCVAAKPRYRSYARGGKIARRGARVREWQFYYKIGTRGDRHSGTRHGRQHRRLAALREVAAHHAHNNAALARPFHVVSVPRVQRIIFTNNANTVHGDSFLRQKCERVSCNYKRDMI